MRTINLPVSESSLQPGQEYLPSNYPSPGLYFNKPNQSWYLAYRCGSAMAVMMLGAGPVCPLESQATPTAAAGISESLLLKAIAVAQRPDLAKELTQ